MPANATAAATSSRPVEPAEDRVTGGRRLGVRPTAAGQRAVRRFSPACVVDRREALFPRLER
jgi:hypothetical protein